MTDEERAEMEADGVAVPGAAATGPGAATADGAVPVDPVANKTSTTGVPGGEHAVPTSTTHDAATPSSSTPHHAHVHTHGTEHNGHLTVHTPGGSTPSPSGTSTPTTAHKKKDDKVGGPATAATAAAAGKNKLTPEQKAKLAALEAEKEKARQERWVQVSALAGDRRWLMVVRMGCPHVQQGRHPR